MRFYNGIEALLYAAVSGAHVGFAPERVSHQYQLVALTAAAPQFIKFVAYDPLIDAASSPVCADHAPATLLVEWFVLRARPAAAAARAYTLVTRTLLANATRPRAAAAARRRAACALDEGIDEALTLRLLGRARGGQKVPPRPHIPWLSRAINPLQLTVRARRALHNVSFACRSGSAL